MSLGGAATAVAELRRRHGLEHHAAVHLLRLVGAVGGRTTSGRRSRLKNRLVGGSRRSWHLVGRAFDHVPPRGDWRRAGQFLAGDRCAEWCIGPVELLDEGDHWHVAY